MEHSDKGKTISKKGHPNNKNIILIVKPFKNQTMIGKECTW